MPPADREPPVCEHCEVPMEWSDRLPGWWCVNCDGSEAEALNAQDEEIARGCDECERVGEHLCDVHGELF